VTFPIHTVDHALRNAVEPLGTKPKFWFKRDGRSYLFKADNRGTGEDWAEVITSHLCDLLQLPHVRYELAIESGGDLGSGWPGSICENMIRGAEALVLGNELLFKIDSNYPKERRYKVVEHTVDAVSKAVGQLLPPRELGTSETCSALDIFVGYIMLDAWTANQDRHHENWGGILDEGSQLLLAPSFDHGSALARNLTEEERQARLRTRDKNYKIEAFAGRARGSFYDAAGRKPLSPRETFVEFAKRAPAAAKMWLAKLEHLSLDDVWSILTQVPPQRMSSIGRDFTSELLLVNQRFLLTCL
jgi:hypothetical protein